MTDPVPTDITFVHLTDLHLSPNAESLINGQSPSRKVERVLNRIQAMEIDPRFVLITGDLVDGGMPDEYRQLQHILAKFQDLNAPILMGLGNHDNRTVFRKEILGETPGITSDPYYHSQEIGGVNVIMLDSHIPGKVTGFLDDEQLSWLDQELAKPMLHGHIIAIHHPPVPCTVELFNKLGLENPDALAAIVHCHTNVLGILSGHIHYSHVVGFANTISVTTPAVLYTVDPGVQQNLRLLNGSGFAIGTVHRGRLMMNTVMISDDEEEIAYREIDFATLDL